MEILRRNNVTFHGQAGPDIVFAHGFGCDQHMWRFVAPAFEATHRVMLFDHIGCGGSDSKAYDAERHANIQGYADDLLQVMQAANVRDAVFVGHSVSAMIGVLASIAQPRLFSRLVLVGPSPRYLNAPPDYTGGFERADIDGLIDMMENNMLGWADFLAPVVMGLQSPAELTSELHASFCASDAYIARRFAMATFLGDNRADLPRVSVPSLIIQCADDAIAPLAVGQYVHQHLKGSRMEVLDASGHCPHMTHPEQTIALIKLYLAGD